MSPEYFIIPVIMGQAAGIIEAIKTGVMLLDCGILLFCLFLFYNTDVEYVKTFYKHYWADANKSSIVISTEKKNRSVKFRAIMHYLAKNNASVYKLKEDTDFNWDDIETRSEYLVDQYKEFKLTEDIYGQIRNEHREKGRDLDQHRVLTEYNTLTIYSYRANIKHLQQWVELKVKEYKEHLKQTSNEKQLFITISNSNGKNNDDREKKRGGHSGNIMIDSVAWDSSITFTNSYFQNMEDIRKKIDFFLQNKAWYLEKGIPYNLGILLYGEPGCGKTRFIKQLMNHTGRHGIDIKLNDGMDFTQLQHIIYKEELDDIHIIPQNQRILIFEDIDALGEVVKDRGLAAGTGKAGANVSGAGASVAGQGASGAGASGAGASVAGQGASVAGQGASVAGSSASASVAGASVAGDDAANELKMLSSFFKMTSANTTNDTKHNNNLSCLLNMIDGIHECSGRIIIMTTNKPEVLDKALIRPGRVDIKIHFQKCSRYDVMKMIEKFWNIAIPLQEILPEVEGKYTCAEIINLFRSTDDFSEIKEIISGSVQIT